MHLAYFTEQPYSLVSPEHARQLHPFDHPARRPGDNVLVYPNRFFDAEGAARLYRERIDEYVVAEESGFDGIMLNEHHNSTFCMQPRITVMTAAVADEAPAQVRT